MEQDGGTRQTGGDVKEARRRRKSLPLALILREPMRWVAGEEGPEIRAKED